MIACPTDVSELLADQSFLEKMMATSEEHLDGADLGVEALASGVAMSASQLTQSSRRSARVGHLTDARAS